MTTFGAHVNYFTDLLPALVVFSLGLAATVAPLTAAVLSDADESDAGIASGVNNAVARVAGLIAIAAIGAVISAQFKSSLDQHLAGIRLTAAARAAVAQARGETLARVDPARAGVQVAHAVQSASVGAFHLGVGISAVLVALGGLLGLVGIQNPRRQVRCEDCAGGQIAGQPLDAARDQTPARASRRRRRVAPRGGEPCQSLDARSVFASSRSQALRPARRSKLIAPPADRRRARLAFIHVRSLTVTGAIFGNITIGKKLYGLAGSLLVFVIVLGIVSISSLSSTDSAGKSMYLDSALPGLELGKISTATVDAHRSLLRTLLYSSDTTIYNQEKKAHAP